MSAQGGERIAADGGTGVLRLALTHEASLLKLASSGQGRTSAVSGFAIVISNAWEIIVPKESCGLLHFHLPVSCLLFPETQLGDSIGGQSD